MSLLKDLRSALEAKGYAVMADVVGKPKRDLWYRHASSTSSIEHVLYLRYMPAGRGYGIYAGVSNPDARNMVKQFLPAYARYVEPIWLDPAGLLARPCWQVFCAARAMNWDYGCIPSPLHRHTWETDLDLLYSRFIEPVFLSIRDLDSLNSLLLKSTMPFEWFMTNPTLRVLELAALAKITNADANHLRVTIEPQFKVMRNNVPGGEVANMVNDIFSGMLAA
jgi:hypothetical protein